MKSGAPAPMMELSDVYISYHGRARPGSGGHHVLNGVSLKLFEGETLGLIGKNGCGKTTILRVMAGILAPSSGRVTRRSGTYAALLSLGLGFKPHLSGRDNAIIAAMLQGATEKEARSHLEAIRSFSELGNAFDDPVKTYSAGMMSRLAFTTALITHVDIMLIDEVLGVGDAQFRRKAEAALKERIKGDQTVVFVSHQGPQVRAICDRAVWLNEGRIAAEGRPKEVLAEYNEFSITRNNGLSTRNRCVIR